MAKIAFYAPMKSPNHPVPSGDREMARGVIAALSDDSRNFVAELVSEFRCYDGKGESGAQEALIAQAAVEADRLIAKGGWAAWVTYHSYYKAPDLLGPVVARALGIPYFLIEATRAAKRLGGPWDRFARLSDDACDAADAIFYLTKQDFEGLQPYQREDQPLRHLQPFLQRENLPNLTFPSGAAILSAGMMREGDKLASYRIIAETLSHLKTANWVYRIAGDGPARAQVEALFEPFGDQVQFLGELDREQLLGAYDAAGVFLWPGVNEAFGMVYLEAQAAGLPVVAQDRPGVRDVLPQAAMVNVGAPEHLAQAVDALFAKKSFWSVRATQARALISECHLLPSARNCLWSVLGPFLEDIE